MTKRITFLLLAVFTLAPTVHAAKLGLETGKVELKSSGPLAFGPQGVLFVGDTKAAAIYAIDTAESKSDAATVKHTVTDVKKKQNCRTAGDNG